MNLKDLFEEQVEDREVALFTAMMLVRARDRESAKRRILGALGPEESMLVRAFAVLVEQYEYFMAPLYGGKPAFLLFRETDEAFSRRKAWRTLASLGYVHRPPGS